MSLRDDIEKVMDELWAELRQARKLYDGQSWDVHKWKIQGKHTDAILQLLADKLPEEWPDYSQKARSWPAYVEGFNKAIKEVREVLST